MEIYAQCWCGFAGTVDLEVTPTAYVWVCPDCRGENGYGPEPDPDAAYDAYRESLLW